MQRRNSSHRIKQFVLYNWLKISILGFLVYVFFQKDLSFQINLNNPSPTRQEAPQKSEPPQAKVKPAREKYTEAQKIPATASLPPDQTSRFQIGLFGGETALPSAISVLEKVDDSVKEKYLKRFAHVAVSEQKKFGIPASIILANSLLHSYAGTRDMAVRGNNHFAIPCGGAWTGASGNYAGGCFRHYKNAWSGFRNHSEYITTGKFEQLRRLSDRDYRGWAKGLEALGYSSEPDLANHLIQIVERYRLNDLDAK
ncbi:MAG: hypothetical protein D6714_20570 [Bacteroidetes bacterium]|nr:MAG: hypothetical protein D6714_20570 [Bacteroidota bacterium]